MTKLNPFKTPDQRKPGAKLFPPGPREIPSTPTPKLQGRLHTSQYREGYHVPTTVRRQGSASATSHIFSATDTNGQPRYKLRARRDSTPSRRSKRDSCNRRNLHLQHDGDDIDDDNHHQHNRKYGRISSDLDTAVAHPVNFREKLLNSRHISRGLPTSSSSITGTMSTGTKWREEQILIICPGSRTTMAQLGCSELTPPTHRFPTRMFKDGEEWRPNHTFLRKKVVDGIEKEEWVEDVDEDEGAVWPIQGGRITHMEAFLAFLEHVHGVLTTTYHNTPIMLMASPQWTRPDCEAIAQYIFEKTRTPALCMINSAIATQYGLKFPNMTVVDIGYEKVDVTAIYDGRVVNHLDLGAPKLERQISGGEVFTQRLLKLLEGKNFNYDMAEKLKKSAICEVLPYAASAKTLVELPVESGAGAQPAPAAPAPEPTVEGQEPKEAPKPAEGNQNEGENGEQNGDDDGVLDVASIVTSGQTREFLAKKEKEKGKPGRKAKDKEGDAAPAKAPRLPNSKRTHNMFVYEEVVQEMVPPEPKEKPAPSNGTEEKPAVPEAAAPDAAQSGVKDAEPAPVPAPAPAPAPASATETSDPAAQSAPQPSTDGTTDAPAPSDAPADAPEESKPTEVEAEKPAALETVEKQPEVAEAKPETKPEAKPETNNENDTLEPRSKRIRRDIEVGLERFTFADREEIDRIVNTIYRTIQGVDDMYMRPACWDNLVFVGNGARLRGLKENVLQTLNARHIVSPSTATMFTSELPSNMATPTGTGAQTPTGSFNGAPHQLSSSGVNPLLQAATTANTLGVGTVGTPQAGSEAGGPTATHHFHSQTPTSIKMVGLPTYLQEWTKNGFEESMFLGAQVAARIVFCLHSNMDAQSIEAQRLANLSRIDYNELGPKGIRTHSMLS